MSPLPWKTGHSDRFGRPYVIAANGNTVASYVAHDALRLILDAGELLKALREAAPDHPLVVRHERDGR